MSSVAYWINDQTRLFLSRGYLKEGQTVEERIFEIASHAAEILGQARFASLFTEDLLQGHISLSSPIWANFATTRGLPISCNNSYLPDTTEGIIRKVAEIGMMTKFGAGTSAYLGALRPRGSPISVGGTSQGPVHFASLIQSTVEIISQSNIRRGSCAIYLPVDHPDIREFLRCRDEGHPIQHLSLGVCVPSPWMQSMIDGDEQKQEVWTLILKKRSESGYPYLFFTDNVNEGKPKVYKDQNLPIYSSNLCSEIALPSSQRESFVCDLASMNLLHFHTWKTTGAVRRLALFLDAVMTEYIQKTASIIFLTDAFTFAHQHRAIGIGQLGWHSLLQSLSIPFESLEAKLLNTQIAKHIDEESLEASFEAAHHYGEPPLLEGRGERWTTRTAIAPTTSSSFILGQVSPSIEPENSNYYTKDLSKGKFTYRNPYLEKVLEGLGQNTEETWRSILLHGGSVQHLEWLPEQQKMVFKTFGEISQKEILIQASARQRYLDQSQSLNLMIHPAEKLRDVNSLIIWAWQNGIKTLYYQRSTNPSQEYVRGLMQECASCEA